MSRRMFRTPGIIVAGIAAVLTGAGQLQAQATHWTGNSSDYWNNAGNWSSGIPTASDLQVQFDPTYSSQLSPINDMSSGTLQTVRLGSTSGNGGFNITGNSLTLSQNNSIGYGITDYGNNTWGLDTTLAAATTFISNNPGYTLTLSGTVSNMGNDVTVSGAGNVTFTNPCMGYAVATGDGFYYVYDGNLTKNGAGNLTLAAVANPQIYPGQYGGSVDNFKNIYVTGGNVTMGSWTGWAGMFGADTMNIGSGATVTMTGPLAVPSPNIIQHGGAAQVVTGGGTLILAQTGSSLANPEITSYFFRSDLCGDIIGTNIELGGSSQHYVQVWAQGFTVTSMQGERTLGQYSSDTLDFAGSLSGTAGLTFDGEPGYYNTLYKVNKPIQATLGLENDNSSWGGGLQIYSGNVILRAANALTAANAVFLSPPDSNHSAGLYLNGNSTAIGNLSGQGGGSMLLVNGGTASATLTINQTWDGTYSGTIADGPDEGYGGGPGLPQGGQLALVLQGGNTLTLNGANYYSGGTSILGGALRIGSTTALGSSSGSLAISGGTLDLNGNSTAVGGLSGTSAAIVNSQPNFATLTTNSPAGSTTYAGTIGGRVALNKGGAGTLALDAANTFSGAAAVNGGQLELDFSAGLATANILPSGISLGLAGGNLWLNGAHRARIARPWAI